MRTPLQCVTATENKARPRGRKPDGEHVLSNAERQARHPVCARPGLALHKHVRAERGPVVGKGRAQRTGRGENADVLVQASLPDPPCPGRLRCEQPGQELALATLDEDLRQVIQPVEGEVPGLEVGLSRRDAGGRRRRHAGQRGIHHRQAPDVARPIRRVGVADPSADVVADDGDAAIGRKASGLDEAMHLGGNGLHVVAGGRPARVAHSTGSSATTRRPAAASTGMTSRQAYQLCGHPGSSRTGGPLPPST